MFYACDYRFLGFLIIALEAPFLCMFVDYMQQVSDVAESKPYWTRAIFYIGYETKYVILISWK